METHTHKQIISKQKKRQKREWNSIKRQTNNNNINNFETLKMYDRYTHTQVDISFNDNNRLVDRQNEQKKS